MNHAAVIPWLLAALLGGAACDPQQNQKAPGLDSSELAARDARFKEALAQPNSDSERAIARWLMPVELSEISGLALTPDGRILTHGDQRGQVFEIDYRRGVVVKQFTLGRPPAKGDFEAITVVGDTVIMLSSDGTLYMFREGTNGSQVPFTVQNTGLGAECEFEGVAFDPATHALLLACKVVAKKSRDEGLVIFRYKLGSGNGAQASKITVPLAQAIGANGWDGLHPSDITVNPLNGNYVIIAGREKALVEITPAGRVVLTRPLPGEHAQPEGVAITKDGVLIISDERGGQNKGETFQNELGAGVITLYRWPLARAPGKAK